MALDFSSVTTALCSSARSAKLTVPGLLRRLRRIGPAWHQTFRSERLQRGRIGSLRSWPSRPIPSGADAVAINFRDPKWV